MSLNESLDSLDSQTKSLRKQILVMKALVNQQTDILKDMMRLRPLSSNSLFGIKPVSSRFPLESQEDLEKLEKSIDSSNRGSIISDMHTLLEGGSLNKRLDRILSMKLILDYNLDGYQKKRRLRDYPNFLNCLYKATDRPGWSDELFDQEIRYAFRQIKNRFSKSMYVKRKRQQDEKDEEDD